MRGLFGYGGNNNQVKDTRLLPGSQVENALCQTNLEISGFHSFAPAEIPGPYPHKLLGAVKQLVYFRHSNA